MHVKSSDMISVTIINSIIMIMFICDTPLCYSLSPMDITGSISRLSFLMGDDFTINTMCKVEYRIFSIKHPETFEMKE